jgi:site-specific recombinase XerD
MRWNIRYKAMRFRVGIRPHLLRHACATHMLKNGCGVCIIKELLGHKRLDTTYIYTEVDREKLREIIAKSHPRNILIT